MNPRPLGAVGRLKGADLLVALQRQRDLVEAFEQPGAAARIDLEMESLSRGRGDRLCLEIDANAPRALRVFDLSGKAIDNFLVDRDGEDAVLKAIGKEDIAEARADDGANAHF